jgi:4-hydroxybenzoate polyprenyltransferase
MSGSSSDASDPISNRVGDASLPSDNLPMGKAVAVIHALRPHQWIKNLLLFLPLLLAHVVPWHSDEDAKRWLMMSAAFAAFCLAASSVYVLNDLLDVSSDQQHRTKRNRPFASGALPRRWGPPISILLLVSAAAICLALPGRFALLLLLYCLLSNLYSIRLKRLLLVDVFVLAGLYTLRIMAGGEAVDVMVTKWLLAFSIFLFVSLAFAKRYTELASLQEVGERGAIGRNYRVEDLRIIESVGPASGYLAVLVLALYINDTTTVVSGVLRFYPSPFFLWLLCPLLMYWITRIWFHARRGTLDDDPILFAIRDRISWMTGVVAVALVVAASIHWNW